MKPKVKLYPFQKEGVLEIERQNGRTLLADEMGLGKTVQDLAYLHRNKKWPAVVLCSATAKYTWESLARLHFGIRATVLESRKAHPLGVIHKEKLIIVNHEILGEWLPHIKKLGIQSVTIDECQEIMNPNTQRAQNARALCKDVEHIRALSGTPLVNRPIELFVALNLIWPEEFNSRIEYGFDYCAPKMQFGNRAFDGARNLDKLHARLVRCGMIRRLQKDVRQQLPPMTRTVIPLPMFDPKGEYTFASNHFGDWLRSKGKGRMTRDSKHAALVKIGQLRKLAAKLKLRNALEYVDNYQTMTGEKVILFAWHIKCIEALERKYKGRCVVIKGDTPARHRSRAVRAFQNNPKINVFIGNLKSASTNITLTAARTMFKLELDYRPGIHLQGEKRHDRIGQTMPTFVHYMVAKGTVEERMCGLLQEKQQNITAVLDGTGGGTEMNIQDLLVAELRKDARKGLL